MRVTWLLISLMIGQTALAAPESARITFKEQPAPEQIVKMSPANYYKVLVGDEFQKVEDTVLRVRRAALNGDPADAKGSYENLNATLGDARKRLVGFPSYKDKDGRLRDAVIEAYVQWGNLCEREIKEAAPLAEKIPKSDADLRAFERIRVELDKGWSSSNTKIREIVDAFAEENRLVFIESDDTGTMDNPFEAELPYKSDLPDATLVSAAIRYHNSLFEHAGVMAEAMQMATDKMSTTDLETARTDALAAIKPALKEAKTFGGFGGSSAFRDAVVGYGNWMVNQLEGPMKKYSELTSEGKVTESQVEELNTISDNLNTEAAKNVATLTNSRNQFMNDWHIEQYVAWQASRK